MELIHYSEQEIQGLTKISKLSLSHFGKSSMEIYTVTKETPKMYFMEGDNSNRTVQIRKSQMGIASYNAWVLPEHVYPAIKNYHLYQMNRYQEEVKRNQEFLDFHKNQLEELTHESNTI